MTDHELLSVEILPSALPPPLTWAEAWDLAKGTNLYAARLSMSRHQLDREGAPACYTLAGHYYVLAQQFAAGACA